jgi:poly(3-hydroxybutyrate) depolymerase
MMQFTKTGACVAALSLSIVLGGCGDSGSETPNDPDTSNASGSATGGSSSATGGSSSIAGGSSGGQTTPSGGIDAGAGSSAAGSPAAGSPAAGGTGGTAAGGNAVAGAGGSGTAGSWIGGQSGDKWGGLKNPPATSAGCGKPAGITTGMKTIMSGGKSREYSIDVPANYDQNKPHLVVFIYHWSGGSAASMKNNRYYNIQPIATAANIPTVFIAPTHSASEADHTVFLDLLDYVETNLCVDSTRIFATGYSLGGMMTYSLTTKQQTKIRAGAGIAAANFNVWLPNPKLKEPIAYMGITGMQDELCIWDGGSGRGAKYIALEKAADNGCTIPAGNNIPTWTSGNHVSYEFQGCKTGYPVIASTFNGPHGGAEVAKDPGASSSWVPKEIWEFFMRF